MKTNKIFLALMMLIPLLIVNCNNKKQTETANQPENNGVDISLTKTDSTINLNLFYVSLKDISIVDILVNNQKASFSKANEELLVLPNDKIKLGRNTVLFIYKKDNKVDTIQKDLFNTLNLEFTVQKTYKHHSKYFTEGLLFDEANNLIESMGMEGKSRIVFYNNFKVKDSIINENIEFGEGLSVHKDKLVQLLWKNGYLKIFDKKTHQLVRDLEFKTEGWGLCNNGDVLYASNGSSVINVIDISGNVASITKSINVHDQNGTLLNINELEFVNGYIFANVWQTDFVYIIDPNTGDAIAKIDFSTLANKEREANLEVDVLNGIAYNKKNKTLFLTGKYWANFYEIKLNSNQIKL